MKLSCDSRYVFEQYRASLGNATAMRPTTPRDIICWVDVGRNLPSTSCYVSLIVEIRQAEIDRLSAVQELFLRNVVVDVVP